MPTTRRQEAIREGKVKPESTPKKQAPKKAARGKKATDETKEDTKMKYDETEATEEEIKKGAKPKYNSNGEEDKAAEAGEKREAERNDAAAKEEEPPAKKTKAEVETPSEPPESCIRRKSPQEETNAPTKDGTAYEEGTIERGHIYLFYRPKVEVTEVGSSSDVQRFHMLLVPRPPAFAVSRSSPTSVGAEKLDPESSSDAEMKILAPGADAVPAPPTADQKKKYRLLTLGKKGLPEQKGRGFWGVITAVGEDLEGLEKGLEGKEYETKTKGTRHQGPARLAARGAYALVNAPARTPSARKTYLGYRISHPVPDGFGDVQISLGLHPASSFIVQVKNPLAPAMTAQQAQTHSKEAQYPEWIMKRVFQGRGKEDYGLRFASCEVPEMLDYTGTQVLLLPSRQDEEGLETTLGEGRGQALSEAEDKESEKSINEVFEELGADIEKFPVEALNGEWI